jgi:hypothetical protein
MTATTHRTLGALLRVVLLLVIAAEINTVRIALTDPSRYVATFPGATGPMFFATLAISLAAGLNAVLIWFRKRWAIGLNVLIGLLSIAMIELVRGPGSSQLVVLSTCAVTTLLPIILWHRGAPLSKHAGS